MTREPRDPLTAHDLTANLERIAGALISAARRDPALKEALRDTLNTWLVALDVHADAGSIVEPEATTQEYESHASKREPMLDEAVMADLREKLGTRAPTTNPSPPAIPITLEALEAQLGLKARVCAAMQRCGGRLNPDAFARFLAEARALPRAWLWMTRDPVATPFSVSLHALAENYALASEVTQHLRLTLGTVEERRWLSLAAEIQNGLRDAVTRLRGDDGTFFDADQRELYHHLTERAGRLRIFLRISLADSADALEHPARRARFEACQVALERERQAEKSRTAMLTRVQYHARRLVSANGSAHDWGRISESVAGLTDMGVTVRDPQLAELLEPLLELCPDDLEPNLKAALLELEQACNEEFVRDSVESEIVSPTIDPTIQRVANWLEGTDLVVLGGDPRPEMIGRFERAFRLHSVIWPVTRVHASLAPLETAVRQLGVRVVLMLIRVGGHSMRSLESTAEAHGKVFISIPAGYSVQQVAAAIITQGSQRLDSSSG